MTRSGRTPRRRKTKRRPRRKALAKRARAKSERGGERRCVATGETAPRTDLIRFVADPSGQIVPDLAEKLPGRGVWVSSEKSAIEKAVSKALFARGLKAKALAGGALADQIETLLAQRCLDALGLARRSGELVLGFDDVRETVKKARPALLIEARDGAADGREKILRLAVALYGAGGERVPVLGCFSSHELGLALGGGNVVHSALRIGGGSHRIERDVRRLSGFRPLMPSDWGFDDPNRKN